jgi:SAM-dependent methyltransferase
MAPYSTDKDWETLAREDPLWAIYVKPGTRGGKWDLDTFLATGRTEVEHVLGRLERLSPGFRRAEAIDFGCGVGRLSLALADHFDQVTGIDAAPTMVEKARELAGDRCTFVLNQSLDLAGFGTDSVDVAYSSLVLQHLPREHALGYLRELMRVTRPDGCAIVQVANRPDWSPKGIVFRFAPRAVINWGQRTLLGYPAAMLMTRLPDRVVRRTVTESGGTVLAAEKDASYGGHWHHMRYYIRPG